MSSHNQIPALRRLTFRRFTGPFAALAMSLLLAGCFQPLYGDRSATGGPGIRQNLGAVDVAQISAPNGTSLSRLAVEVRNGLLFELTGGNAPPPPTHRLKITLASTNMSVIVDVNTARPDVQNYGIDAFYTLTEIGTNKVVMTSRTFARVSYDIPGQEQRFARARGLRDAENRASKVIAENIRTRLASYFVAGT
jgi:LPS-assembly lipoprotein